MRRNRSKPHSLNDHLANHKARLEAKAAKLKEGPEKEYLRKKIEQVDMAFHMHAWLSP